MIYTLSLHDALPIYNLYKGIADGLEGVVYHNDSQICDLQVIKKTAAQEKGPKVMIEISTIDE